jgi:cytochrome c peroxidase
MKTIQSLSMALVIGGAAGTFAACGSHGPQEGRPETASSLDAALEARLADVSQGAGPAFFRLPESEELDLVPQDPKNPITPEKVELGRLLFHETALGTTPELELGEGTYSCASCHHAKAGFQAGVSQAIGEGGAGFGAHGEGRVPDASYPTELIDVQPIRTPAALNAAYQENMTWSGQLGATGLNEGTKYAWMGARAFNRLGYEGVETQAMAALQTHRLDVGRFVARYPLYRDLFDLAFPEIEERRRYTRVTAALAIAAYERTLLADRAPFQRWLRGERAAMSAAEKQGAILFFGTAGCVTCHTGPALNSLRFEAIGMKDLWEHPAALNATVDSVHNEGRGGFTDRPEDMYRFKVPQLYNLADADFYGHGASFTDLKDVVAYKNEGRAENDRVPSEMLSDAFVPLGLSDEEIDLLVIFLGSALRDPELDRYVPEVVLSGTCFPNNDARSRAEIGCP